jgi:hypothetical protein
MDPDFKLCLQIIRNLPFQIRHAEGALVEDAAIAGNQHGPTEVSRGRPGPHDLLNCGLDPVQLHLLRRSDGGRTDEGMKQRHSERVHRSPEMA